jgi:cobalamin biosynthesis Mg chelatase CobN
MRRITTKILGMGAAVMLSATLASAQGPDASRTTIVTFSAPVALPGVTLPAGSYLFKLGDSQVNRNIVQVFDKDRTKIFATILAIPAQRNEPADETVITFRETPANMAPAIRYWYYPGERTGQEFAYPKKQATEIANATHTSVLAIDTDETSADAMAKGQITRVQPGADTNQTMAQGAQPSTAGQAPSSSAQSQPATPAPSAASSTDQSSTSSTPSTAAQRAQGSQNNTTPSMSSSSNTQSAVGTSGSTPRRRLPKTASTLPLIGLAGLLALGSAFGIGTLRRARA